MGKMMEKYRQEAKISTKDAQIRKEKDINVLLIEFG